ncbi:uncharacterized protein LOC143290243 [Babylonia areolata]|uniref:uncharacterized protein LOC143290243 n=1 Tax=Babylonia areolata TaxID=304850 RepID=UPI003FD431C7
MFTNHTPVMVTDLSTAESFTEFTDTPKSDPRPWESADPFFSADTRDLIKTVFKCYVRQFIIFLGIPCNFISCVVFYKQGLSDRISLLLFWVAVADLGYLVTQSLYLPSCYLSDKVQINNWSTILNAKITRVKTWLNYTCGSLIMIMSVDRCLSVVMPLKARRLLTFRPMLVAIILSYLVPFGVYLTCFLSFTVQWRVDPSTNRSVAYMTDTPWFPVDVKLAPRICYFFTVSTKPVYLVTVIVCCVITISHLHRASRQRSQMAGSVKEKSDAGDRRITKMLLFLCVVHAAILSLDVCAGMANILVPEFYVYQKYHNSFVVLHQMLTNPAFCANSAVNFFAYLVASSRFRKTLKELFICFQRK